MIKRISEYERFGASADIREVSVKYFFLGIKIYESITKPKK